MYFNRDIIETVTNQWVEYWHLDLYPEALEDLLDRLVLAEGPGGYAD